MPDGSSFLFLLLVSVCFLGSPRNFRIFFSSFFFPPLLFFSLHLSGRSGERYIIGGENITVKQVHPTYYLSFHAPDDTQRTTCRILNTITPTTIFDFFSRLLFQLLEWYAEAAHVSPPWLSLPNWLMMWAATFGFLPLEVGRREEEEERKEKKNKNRYNSAWVFRGLLWAISDRVCSRQIEMRYFLNFFPMKIVIVESVCVVCGAHCVDVVRVCAEKGGRAEGASGADVPVVRLFQGARGAGVAGGTGSTCDRGQRTVHARARSAGGGKEEEGEKKNKFKMFHEKKIHGANKYGALKKST